MNSGKSLRGPTVATCFLICFLILLVALNVVVGVFWIGWLNPIRALQFIILQAINIGVAYGLTELLFSLLLSREDLPHLVKLRSTPSVALLYTVCDDAMLEALRRLGNQSYKHHDVFVLDDSSQPHYRALVDEAGFRVLRRDSRKGFKAGNLNNWLAKYGAEYQYFVVVDSDSILDDDFIIQMLKYAEHPANRDIAIFQSKIRVWNLDSSFARAIAAWYPLWYYWIDKLANRCGMALSWGHNCLYRTAMIRGIGGFEEEFIAEDYATALTLLRRGYECRFVDTISYEAVPTSMHSYTRRAVRWARQTLQLFRADMTGVPFINRLHIFMNAYSFAIWLLYIPGMFLAVWGYQSTIEDVFTLTHLVLSGKFIHTPLLKPVLVMLFFITYFLLARLPLAMRLGISVKNYFGTLILILAMGPYMMVPLSIAQLAMLFSSRKMEFDVTDKTTSKASFRGLIREMRWGILLVSMVVLGLIRNPAALLWNWPWLLPFVISPVVIHLVQRDSREPPTV